MEYVELKTIGLTSQPLIKPHRIKWSSRSTEFVTADSVTGGRTVKSLSPAQARQFAFQAIERYEIAKMDMINAEISEFEAIFEDTENHDLLII